MVTDKEYTASDAKILSFDELNVTSPGIGTFTLPDGQPDEFIYLLAQNTSSSVADTFYASEPVKLTNIHNWGVTGSGATATITDNGKATSYTATIASESKTYDGSALVATVTKSSGFPSAAKVSSIIYKGISGTSYNSTDAPSKAGKYTASATVTVGTSSVTISAQLTINNAAPIVNAPEAKNLTENGASQQLVNAGTAKNGTIKYALGTGNKTAPSADKFTTAIPTGKAEGTYYVWYRVDGNANYSGIAAKCVTVTIAHSHNLKKFAAKAATESAEGNKEYYYYCDKCKKYFLDAEGKNEIAKDSWIIKKLTHKHKLVHVAAKAATANKAGNKEYWKCSGCGKFFSDAKGTKEIKKNSWVIPKKTPKKKDTKITDKNSKGKYVVTSKQSQTPTVSYTGATSSNLKSVSIPATIKYDGITYKVTAVAKGALKNKKKLTKVTIGKNVKSLGAEALSGCTGLKTLTMGANVTSIGDKALYNCTSLQAVTLPAKTQKLGKQFAGKCKKLKKLTIKCTTMSKSTISDKAFTNMPNSAAVTVYVPKNKVSAYTSLFRKKGLGKKVKVKKIK